MARIVGRSRPQSDGSTAVKLPEMIVFALLILGAAGGGYWYYQYRKGPAFALQCFFDMVKTGVATDQYVYIDDEDKKLMATVHDYATATQLAHGYSARIASVTEEPVVQTKNPDEVTIKATVAIRDSGEGKELYQGGGTHSFTDTYFMRKNADGKWKIVLTKSGNNSPTSCCNNMEIDKAPPTAAGFN